MFKKFFSCLSLLFLSACSEAKFASVNAPALTYEGQIIQNVAYGNHDRQKLDIYIPEKFEKPLPAIVFFHGGRWSEGAKDQYKFVGMTLSKQGYIVVLPNTRLYPDVKHPSFAQDGAKAVAWVHNNIKGYGGNRNLFLSGHSSGAHIASLVTANEEYLAEYDLSPDIINAFAGLSGPYDFVPQDEDLKDMFGESEEAYSKAMATPYIDGDEPPMLLIYGQADEKVWARNHELLAQKIREKGGNVTVKLYPDANHIDTVSALSWINPAGLDVVEEMTDFFSIHRE
jgi:acetyl esterase/lipase